MKTDIDVSTGYRALRHGTGLLDHAGTGLFRVAGPGAGKFVGTASSRNADFLLEGQIAVALLLRANGTVVAEALIHCDGAEYLLEVWPAQRDAAAEHLRSLAETVPDVTVTDVGERYRVLAVEGPESYRIAKKYLSFPISSMAYRSFAVERWNDADLLISRTGVTGEYGYKLHAPAEAADELSAELAELGAQRAGPDALDICRMEMRFVNLEREGGPDPFTPFDVGLQWMVDFQHEFLGRDAALRIWEQGPERSPICWKADASVTAVPERGAPLLIGGIVVGAVSHAVWSPSLERVIGTARVDRAVAASGVEFLIDDAQARSISAPFLVPSSFGRPLE
ncbi:aminomethyl transferase family protein [Nocardia arthritidis]|uniref:Aminomethyl transferase family protein n=1 Tax=Nocardia arthritidis TaxID=228602 RepID=A0A6G9YE87_9NOCA|nr:aminomethyl transferase family protein [Nocardia arthritidis]QIS11595.1 hypothetical protein F5544_18620 [Nocardia arthritidis]